MDTQKPRIAARRVIFESKRFRVVEKDMEFAGGARETWEVVEQKGNGGARVLALTNREELIFIREYRGAAEKYVVRVPTGVIENGESPEDAARRELEEETGFVAGAMEPLGILEPKSGYYKELPIHVFFANNLKETRNTAREPGEQDMEMMYIPLERAFSMAENVELEDAQTVYAILMLKKHLWKKK